MIDAEIHFELNHFLTIEMGKGLNKPLCCVVVSISRRSLWFYFIHISIHLMTQYFVDCPVSRALCLKMDLFSVFFPHFCVMNFAHNLFIDTIYISVVGSNTIIEYGNGWIGGSGKIQVSIYKKKAFLKNNTQKKKILYVGCWCLFISKYSLYYFTTDSFFQLEWLQSQCMPVRISATRQRFANKPVAIVEELWKTFLIPNKAILTVVSIRHLVFLEPKVFTLRWVSNFLLFFYIYFRSLYLLLTSMLLMVAHNSIDE